MYKAKKFLSNEWVFGELNTYDTLIMFNKHSNGISYKETKIDRSTLCESTKIKDKYNIDIFEHDIVEFYPHNDNEIILCKVEKIIDGDTLPMFLLSDMNYRCNLWELNETMSQKLKVIGNVYDNKQKEITMKETEMSEVEETKPNRRSGKTAELLAKVETLIRNHQIAYVFSAKELKDLLERNSKVAEIALRIMIEVFCTCNRPFIKKEIEEMSLVEDVIKYVKEQAIKEIKREGENKK